MLSANLKGGDLNIMKEINVYLNFPGNCREAMEFYKKCLGGDLQLMPYSGSPMKVPEGSGDLIIHARLANGKAVVMASDSMPGRPIHTGNNFWVAVACESPKETDRIFAAMSEQAISVVMPPQETFWAARFAMLTDKFGVNWMFNCENPMN
jgi:PhnB protein